MATELRLPLLGDIMTEGTLRRWLQADGARVEAGQPLYELETDKVSFTVEAPAAGVLRRLVTEGEVVQVGGLVGRLEEAAEAGPAPSPEPVSLPEPPVPPGPASVEEPVGPAPPVGPARLRATPAARRLARELGIDLAALGSERRLREADVRAWQAASERAAPEATAYAGRRRAIGERMVRSLQTSAQVTLNSEVRVDAVLDMIEGLNREWRERGVVLTLTRAVVKAVAVALGDHRHLNVRLEGERIVPREGVHVGVAMDQEAGLIVPVLHEVDRMSLEEVARELRELTRRAEAGRLTQADLEGATFTVSSLESTVVDAFTPIVDPPQAAVLGLGRVREVAAFEGSGVVRRRVATLSLTFDHRVTDGAPAARFLGRLADLLERPYLLLEGRR
ncbi:MAG TPA: dihydrolipoamide acetyltransferase family protein [Candidatus Dormibacteraeota bacterium]|nr:dihydrolipoamide acetyltransferase family protein [Candidatus Dormibacteraeota bacterium]